MTTSLHSTAVVDAGAVLGEDVVVSPYCVIGPNVEIGDGSYLAPHAVIERNTRIGRACLLGVGAVVGGDPQDRKFRGTETWVEIGDHTVIRDYSTVNRGTEHRGVTRVGSHCFLMTYVHVAHDCQIEDHVTLANAVQLAGHVTVEPHAVIGGSSPVHQFVRIGTHAFVGGGSRVPQDIPPYTRAAGNPLRLYGINTLGLTRAGIGPETRQALKHAYRLLFNSRLPLREAISRLEAESQPVAEVRRLLVFVASSERGVLA